MGLYKQRYFKCHTQVTMCMNEDELKLVDGYRGNIPRSRFVKNAIKYYVNGIKEIKTNQEALNHSDNPSDKV